jgi:hypothetical protein
MKIITNLSITLGLIGVFLVNVYANLGYGLLNHKLPVLL